MFKDELASNDAALEFERHFRGREILVCGSNVVEEAAQVVRFGDVFPLREELAHERGAYNRIGSATNVAYFRG